MDDEVVLHSAGGGTVDDVNPVPRVLVDDLRVVPDTRAPAGGVVPEKEVRPVGELLPSSGDDGVRPLHGDADHVAAEGRRGGRGDERRGPGPRTELVAGRPLAEVDQDGPGGEPHGDTVPAGVVQDLSVLDLRRVLREEPCGGGGVERRRGWAHLHRRNADGSERIGHQRCRREERHDECDGPQPPRLLRVHGATPY